MGILLFSSNRIEVRSKNNNQNLVEFQPLQYSIETITHLTKIIIYSVTDIIVEEDICFDNKQNISISQLNLWLNYSFRDLNISDNEGELYSFYSELTNIITVNLRNELNTNQTQRITLEYKLGQEIQKISGKPSFYQFIFRPSFYFFTYYYRMSIRLPDNCFLYEGEDVPSYYPENVDKDVKGNRIILTWELSNVPPLADKLFLINYSKPLGANFIWIVIVGPIFGVICGAIIVFWWMRRRERISMKEVSEIFLSDDQKLLLKLIADSEGKLTQKELIELTNFTKSKISRNLKPLEENNLIEKERWGREYKVNLTEKGKKVIE